jgi:hypothetical protein
VAQFSKFRSKLYNLKYGALWMKVVGHVPKAGQRRGLLLDKTLLKNHAFVHYCANIGQLFLLDTDVNKYSHAVRVCIVR